MKRNNIYTKFLLGAAMLLAGSGLTSCDDFLTILPTDQLPEENFYQDKNDLNGVRAGAYEQLSKSGMTSKILAWGELRSDNLQLNDVTNTSISYIQNAILQPTNGFYDWSGFYTGIGYCNLVIEKGDEMTKEGSEVDPSFSHADYQTLKAEMLALRSLYYFYLVRAYRDVPYITSAVRTDAEATSSYPAATPGVAILGDCIAQLDSTVQYAATNFGSGSENKGRFTKNSIKALIADMCLWRACMLKDYVSKTKSMNGVNATYDGRVNISDVAGDTILTSDGTLVNDAYCNAQATVYLNKAIERCNEVIDDINKEYQEDISTGEITQSSSEKNQLYPLYHSETTGATSYDNPYAMNFVSHTSSREILFELTYDGTSTTNSTVNNYFSTYSNSDYNPAYMAVSSTLLASTASVNPEVGFGKTDYRLWETTNFATKETVYPIIKHVVQSITVSDYKDVTTTTSPGTGRTSSTQSASWPVYRLADVMLIEAEAIARTSTTDGATLVKGYSLVNELFRRNNPALVTSSTTDPDLVCERVNNYGSLSNGRLTIPSDFATNHTASSLLALVYRERQREFIAEGKRWFDLTRQAEASNDTKTTLSTYATVKSAVQSRLSNLWGFYSPIYSSEYKVNGVEYGGKLVQNPVWNRYTKK